MKKAFVIVLAIFAVVILQIAKGEDGQAGDDAEGTADGDTGVRQGQVSNSRFYYPTQRYWGPYPTTAYRPRQRLDLRRIIRLLLIFSLFQSSTTTKAPETTKAEETTVAADTTVAMTTADPCLSWTPAHNCRYKMMMKTVSWNAAMAECPDMCNSKLAHEKIRTKAEVDVVIAALSHSTTLPFWVGLSDTDSLLSGGSAPKWDKTTDSTLTFTATAHYETLPGSPGCGFWTNPEPSAGNPFKFEQCSFTSASTPNYFLCEACP